MENNPLLEALKEYRNGYDTPFNDYLQNTDNKELYAHILDLLERQRKKCADEAMMVFMDRGNDIDELSITNAKLI